MKRNRSHTLLRSGLLILAAVLLITTVVPPALAQDPGREGLSFLDTGPLRVREQFLPNMGFLAFDPVSADVLDRGGWQVDLVYGRTNTWALSESAQAVLEERDRRAPFTVDQLRAVEPKRAGQGILFVDGELSRSSLSLRYGATEDLQLQLTVPVLDFGGGVGDQLVQEFHDTFDFGQAGRLGVPKDAYLFYLRDGEGNETIRTRRPSSGLGDVTAGFKLRLPGSERFKWALEGLVKAPTGDEEKLYGSGAWDFGLHAVATRYFDRSCIHLAFGAIHLGEPETFALDSQVMLSGMVGFERALGRSTSAVLQLTVSESPFRDLDLEDVDDVTYLVDLGIKRGLSEHVVLFFALSENLVNFNNSADVGAHVGLTWTL